jgi:hypothetical protein
VQQLTRTKRLGAVFDFIREQQIERAEARSNSLIARVAARMAAWVLNLSPDATKMRGSLVLAQREGLEG